MSELTLTDFLLARLAEDERVARDAVDPNYGTDPDGRWVFVEFPYEGEWPRDPADVAGQLMSEKPWCLHANRHDPARILAECEAKRRIVNELENDSERHSVESYWMVLRLLALPYADHPDYREEWKP